MAHLGVAGPQVLGSLQKLRRASSNPLSESDRICDRGSARRRRWYPETRASRHRFDRR